MKSKKNLNPYGGIFDTPLKRKRILEIESESNTDPCFWNDRRKSSALLKEKKNLEEAILSCENLLKKFEDTLVAIEFGEEGDEQSVKEADDSLLALANEVNELETKRDRKSVV